MATENDTRTDVQEEIHGRLLHAIAIADLMGIAEPEHVANDTLTNAASAIQDMLREVIDLRAQERQSLRQDRER